MMRAGKLATVIAASLFILAVGTILNSAVLYWMAGILLSLPGIGRLYAVLQARGVAVVRLLPATGRVGEWIEVELHARNTAALPKLQLWLAEDLPSGIAAEAGLPAPIQLAPLGTAAVVYRARLDRRGRHQLREVCLVSLDPLGLSAVSLALPAASEILVYPRVIPLRRETLPLGAESGAAHEDTSARRGEGATFYGIRQYQPGDPLRRVHWRSSARWGRLAVVEFEDERSCDMLLALETVAGSSIGPGIETSFEYGVTLAASLASLAVREGHSVSLLAPGYTSPSFEAQRGSASLSEILEVLAGVEADSRQSLVDELPAAVAAAPRGTTVFWITPLASERLVHAARLVVNAGITLTILALDAPSFGAKGRDEDWGRVAEQLAGAGARCACFRKGDPIPSVLAAAFGVSR